MTDETKKLFGAPWTVDENQSETFGEIFDVMDEELYLHYARCYDEKTANRLARLPELYDALAEAAENYCGICHNLSGQEEPKIEDLIKTGCPKKRTLCKAIKWLDLLKRVMDGE